MEFVFDAELLPDALHDIVGRDLLVRPLAKDDYQRGHIELLSVLTDCPDPGEGSYHENFHHMKSHEGIYFPIMILSRSDPSTILATGTLLMEKKFIHGISSYGHIEDIAVSKSAQGKGLGKKLIQCLSALSASLGAYKTILDCSKDNVAFYEKCGFENKGFEMIKYHQQ